MSFEEQIETTLNYVEAKGIRTNKEIAQFLSKQIEERVRAAIAKIRKEFNIEYQGSFSNHHSTLDQLSKLLGFMEYEEWEKGKFCLAEKGQKE